MMTILRQNKLSDVDAFVNENQLFCCCSAELVSRIFGLCYSNLYN
jgi:hypothetical protein